MLIEQLIFIIIAFALFVYMFYQLIKKNDTKYVPILAIQALGIAIDFVKLYFSEEKSIGSAKPQTYIGLKLLLKIESIYACFKLSNPCL